MHNLATVLAFELRRTLLKPTFWLTSLSVPVLMAVIFALSFFSNTSAAARAEQSASEVIPFTYADASGIVSPDVAARLGGTPTSDADAAAEAVREGRSEAFIAVPARPAEEPVQIMAKDRGLMDTDRWVGVARSLVSESAAERIGDPSLVKLTSGVPTHLEAWKDGRLSPGWAGAIAPGVFLVLLYMAIIMLGQQMLNITVEEKENRVTEMILTTIKPTTLIVGKVLGVIIAGFVQGLVVLVPLVIWFGVQAALAPPGSDAGTIDLNGQRLVVEPEPVIIAALLFIGGFLLFTALLVAIGAVMPTAKDAGSAFGVVILAMFLPLYTLGFIVGEPNSLLSVALSWFPLTAPVTAQLRNATGGLGLPEAIGILVAIYVSAGLLLALGVRLFRQGSIAYDVRLPVLKVLRSSRG